MSRHRNAPKRTAAQERLVQLYESIGNQAEYYLDMQFQAGDLQLLSNHTVLHARTGYVDWPQAHRRRHLLRLWLSVV